MDEKGHYIPLEGEATNASGGLFADAASAAWLKENGIAGMGDKTAGYRPNVPEQLLRCRADASAIGSVAGTGVQVQLAPQMAVEVQA